ncbi:hypothetical protein [Streptomyces sp. NBC_00996]|uniref:hypothetical protein n=1 Tax=Streptomyces sp. NBC_00996 TaxID=2903710 RepID=UPI0038657F20|nr:hypothetical protein OG390_18080 [Streptomyces sp. NBC_00996]
MASDPSGPFGPGWKAIFPDAGLAPFTVWKYAAVSASKSIPAFFAPRSLEHWYQVYDVHDGGPPCLTMPAQSWVKAMASGVFMAGSILPSVTVKSLRPLRLRPRRTRL